MLLKRSGTHISPVSCVHPPISSTALTKKQCENNLSSRRKHKRKNTIRSYMQSAMKLTSEDWRRDVVKSDCEAHTAELVDSIQYLNLHQLHFHAYQRVPIGGAQENTSITDRFIVDGRIVVPLAIWNMSCTRNSHWPKQIRRAPEQQAAIPPIKQEWRQHICYKLETPCIEQRNVSPAFNHAVGNHSPSEA